MARPYMLWNHRRYITICARARSACRGRHRRGSCGMWGVGSCSARGPAMLTGRTPWAHDAHVHRRAVIEDGCIMAQGVHP